MIQFQNWIIKLKPLSTYSKLTNFIWVAIVALAISHILPFHFHTRAFVHQSRAIWSKGYSNGRQCSKQLFDQPSGAKTHYYKSSSCSWSYEKNLGPLIKDFFFEFQQILAPVCIAWMFAPNLLRNLYRPMDHHPARSTIKLLLAYDWISRSCFLKTFALE